jgi:hypothetical protein
MLAPIKEKTQTKSGIANIPATTTFVHQPFEGGTQRNDFATLVEMRQRPVGVGLQLAPFL